jgi:HPt (histidine-containing phosphotransfer) domain-containing protein
MNTTQAISEHAPINMPVQPATGKPKFINSDYLLEISDGNPDFIQVFLATFKEETKRSLVNLQNQLENNDFIFMEKTAHAMKPTGVYVGSYPLTLLVGLVEKAAHAMDHCEVTRLIPQVQSLAENILKEIDEHFN